MNILNDSSTFNPDSVYITFAGVEGNNIYLCSPIKEVFSIVDDNDSNYYDYYHNTDYSFFIMGHPSFIKQNNVLPVVFSPRYKTIYCLNLNNKTFFDRFVEKAKLSFYYKEINTDDSVYMNKNFEYFSKSLKDLDKLSKIVQDMKKNIDTMDRLFDKNSDNLETLNVIIQKFNQLNDTGMQLSSTIETKILKLIEMIADLSRSVVLETNEQIASLNLNNFNDSLVKYQNIVENQIKNISLLDSQLLELNLKEK